MVHGTLSLPIIMYLAALGISSERMETRILWDAPDQFHPNLSVSVVRQGSLGNHSVKQPRCGEDKVYPSSWDIHGLHRSYHDPTRRSEGGMVC
ncbi:hypothetical protein B0I35DRAFT_432404, partial [Stachybotrys elegans]